MERLKKIFIVAAVCLLFVTSAAATPLFTAFDTLAEGTVGSVLTDGGITFSDLDQRIPGPHGPYTFSIESTDGAQFGPLFSPPNYLKAGGYAPGSGFSLGRFGSARITFEEGSAASVSIAIYSGFDATNVLTLNALRQGSVVGSATIGFSQIVDWQTNTLSISGVVFDELRLVGSGQQNDGTVFIGIDNVAINTVAEPTTVLPLTLGLMLLVGVRSGLSPRR